MKFATGVIVVVLLAGCAPTASSPEPLAAVVEATDDRVVVEWFVGLGTGAQPEQVAAQEAVVAQFNAAQDDILLELDIVDGRLAYQELTDRIAAGDAPDIVGPVGIRGANTFRGQFLDLSTHLPNDVLDAYDPAQVEVYREGDALTAIPFGVFPSMIFVNTELFARAGLDLPPTSFEDPAAEEWDTEALTDLAKRLTLDANGRNATNPDFDPERIVQWGFTHQFLEDPRAHGTFFGPGSLVADDGGAQVPEVWLEEWRWFHDGMWTSRFMPTQAEAQSDLLQGGNAFASGRVAMAFTHLWYTGSIVDENGTPGDFWDLAIVPSHDGTATSKLHADGFRVMANTEHPAEAVEVLRYLHDEAALELLDVYGSFPARTDLRDAFFTNLDQRFPQDVDWSVVAASLSRPDVPSHEAALPATDEAQALLDAFEATLRTNADLDVDEAAEALRVELDQLFRAHDGADPGRDDDAPPTD